MTDFVEPAPVVVEERSQTRTLVRHDDFDVDDDDDVVTGEPKERQTDRPKHLERPRDSNVEHDEGSSESTAPPSRATTDPASTIRDSGYSDVTYGSRNFTPGLCLLES